MEAVPNIQVSPPSATTNSASGPSAPTNSDVSLHPGDRVPITTGKPYPLTPTGSALDHRPHPDKSDALWKRKPHIERKTTYVAQALILFNVWGLTLSSGPYLQYYYNSPMLNWPPLLPLSSIPAAQIFFLFLAPLPVGWLYTRHWWKACPWLSWIAIVISTAVLQSCTKWWTVLALRSLQAFCLGTFGTLGTLCVASHYRNNVPLASMVCVSAGLLGALTYTGVVHYGIDALGDSSASTISAVIAGITLLFATVLLKQNPQYADLPLRRNSATHSTTVQSQKDRGTIPFLIGYMMSSFALFTYPLYAILIHTSPPISIWPTDATSYLLLTYTTAFLTSSLTASPWFRKRLGPVNTFIAISICNGAGYLFQARLPHRRISLLSSLGFGAGLGAWVALFRKVLMVFLWRGEGRMEVRLGRVGWTLMGAGSSAAAGLLGTAAMVRRGERGFEEVMVVLGSVMVGGGVLMAVGRGLRGGSVWMVSL